MKWKWGKRETGLRWVGSGPHKLGLLKEMAAEIGNYIRSLESGEGERIALPF